MGGWTAAACQTWRSATCWAERRIRSDRAPRCSCSRSWTSRTDAGRLHVTATLGLSAHRVLAAAASMFLVGTVAAAQSTVTIPELKAEFVFNLVKFVEWPGDAVE